MRRTLILCAGALLIAAPASAHEKHGKHAKVSKARDNRYRKVRIEAPGITHLEYRVVK